MSSNHALEIPRLGHPSGHKGGTRSVTKDMGDPRASRDQGRRHRDFERPSRPPRPSYNASADSAEGWSPLSSEEEGELADRIRRGDQAARKELILANLRLVVSIVRRYRSRKLSFDDLVQEGNLGLIRASQDFDPAVHGTRFSTYAEIWISAFIYRALIANESLIRVPEHVFVLRKRYRLKIAALGGADRNADAPSDAATIEQVAREMGISARQLEPARLVRLAGGRRGEPDETGEAGVVSEAMVDRRRPDEEVAIHEERLLLEVALRRLNPVEAWLIRERYGLSASIPGEADLAAPNPSNETGRDRASGPDPTETDQTYFHRTYAELESDCGLTRHRIHQVEQIALEKLRDVLGPRFFRSI